MHSMHGMFCMYSGGMGKPLQIRDVPDELLHVLRVRAAEEEISVSGYVLRLLQEHATRPSIREVMNRRRTGWVRATRDDVLAAIREGHEEQSEKLDEGPGHDGR
jgi:plasmid stability protein